MGGSWKETVASAFLPGLEFQEYRVRSAAEATPEERYGYRPAEGKFKNEKPQFGPAEVRTFAEQVKHVACANFAFAAEFDGQKPPDACDQGGPSPAKTKKELLIYLRDSFTAIRKSLGVVNVKNMFDQIEGPAQRRPLRPDDAPPAPERHRPACQPQESTRAPSQLLRFRGVSFICT